MWRSLEIFKVFNTLTLKEIFWKTQTFFRKLEYSFSVESTKIDNATFPHKTALPEANVWTYRKERGWAGNYFPFSKILFQFDNTV